MSEEKAAVKLSTRSWHYKLMRFILGSAAPTPQNMHNLCPYFWLLIFSMLVSPIVAPLKLIWKVFVWLLEGLATFVENTMIIPACESYEENLSDMDLYQIIDWDMKLKKLYASYHNVDNAFSSERKKSAYKIWEERYGKKVFESGEISYYGNYTDEFQDWREKMRKEYDSLQEEIRERQAIRREAEMRYEEKMSKFRDGMDAFGDRIVNFFKTMKSWKNIIKWTKRVVGLIVTGTLLVATYFIVNFIGRGVLWLIEHWDWETVAIAGGVILVIGIIAGLVLLLRAFVYYVAEHGMKLWIVKIIYWPIYILVWWPLKIVFYHFLVQIIAINAWYFIRRGARLVWGSILGFLGIFGEYFGASYTDYCPGIEWDEE